MHPGNFWHGFSQGAATCGWQSEEEQGVGAKLQAGAHGGTWLNLQPAAGSQAAGSANAVPATVLVSRHARLPLLSPPSHVSCSPRCVRESPDASATRARWQPGRQQAPPLLFKTQQAVSQPSLQPLRPMTTSFPPRPSITTTSQLLQGAMPPPISGAGREGKRHKAAGILKSTLYSEFNKGNILRHLLIRICGSSSSRTPMPRPLKIASPGAREFRCLRSCAWAHLSPLARTQARAHSNTRKGACHTGLVHAGVICLQHFVYMCVCVPV
jgi:hypothetical protein